MLRVFKMSDISLLQEWVSSEELLFRFAGTGFTYPLTAKQIEDYAIVHPERQFYLGLLENNAPYAFGEIIPQKDSSVRLGRILIGNPEMRGKNLGVRFVQALVEEAKKAFHADLIDLFVIKENVSAIRCYQKAGFTFTDDLPFELPFRGEAFPILKMNRRLK